MWLGYLLSCMVKPYAICCLYTFMMQIVIIFISYSELLFVIKLFHILLPSCPVQRVHIEIGMGFFNMFIRCLNWSAATEAFLDSRDHAVGPWKANSSNYFIVYNHVWNVMKLRFFYWGSWWKSDICITPAWVQGTLEAWRKEKSCYRETQALSNHTHGR